MALPKIFLAISLLLVFIVSSCGVTELRQDPGLMIEGYNPPKFKISGQGALDIIYVIGPDVDRNALTGGADYMKHYWGIMPKGKYDISRLEELGPITYGQVPEGFVRVDPEHGEVPTLFEDGRFAIHLGMKDGRAASRFFTLHNGKIVAEGD